MTAWTVAILTICQHGHRLTSLFTCATSRAEAMAQGVHHALAAHDGHCQPDVVGSAAYAVAPEVMREAVEAIEARS